MSRTPNESTAATVTPLFPQTSRAAVRASVYGDADDPFRAPSSPTSEQWYEDEVAAESLS